MSVELTQYFSYVFLQLQSASCSLDYALKDEEAASTFASEEESAVHCNFFLLSLGSSLFFILSQMGRVNGHI